MGGWEGRGMHSEDILCLSYLPPQFLATGKLIARNSSTMLHSVEQAAQYTQRLHLCTSRKLIVTICVCVAAILNV